MAPEEHHIAEITGDLSKAGEQLHELLGRAEQWAQKYDDPDNVERSHALEVAVGSLRMADGAVELAASMLKGLVVGE